MKESEQDFTLSLPILGRPMGLRKNIASTHRNPAIPMCFLRNEFALSLWEKYITPLFYDEFLAHMVWLLLDKNDNQEKQDAPSQLQTIFRTIYMHTRETMLLREIERVVTEEGADREAVLLVFREELEKRIASEPGELNLRLYETVERTLRRVTAQHVTNHMAETQKSINRVSLTQENQNHISVSQENINHVLDQEIADHRLRLVEEQVEQVLSETEAEELKSEQITHIIQQLRERSESVLRQEETRESETLTTLLQLVEKQVEHSMLEEKSETHERMQVQTILTRIFQSMEKEDMKKTELRDEVTYENRVRSLLVHHVEERVMRELSVSESESLESIISILHRVKEETERDIHSTETDETEQVITVLRHFESQEKERLPQEPEISVNKQEFGNVIKKRIREDVKHERHERFDHERSIRMRYLNLAEEQIERAVHIGENIERKKLIALLDHVEETLERTIVGEDETVTVDQLTRILHRVKEDTVHDITETKEDVIHDITEVTEDTISREAVTAVLNKVRKTLETETWQTENTENTEKFYNTSVHHSFRYDSSDAIRILHRIHGQVETELREIEGPVVTEILQQVSPGAYRRSRVLMPANYRYTDATGLPENPSVFLQTEVIPVPSEIRSAFPQGETLFTPTRTNQSDALPEEPTLIPHSTYPVTPQADYPVDTSEELTLIPRVTQTTRETEEQTEVIRRMNEEITEIVERDEETMTIISELQNDVKKAEDELEEMRTRTRLSAEEREEEIAEEKRDAYHEEIVKDLFDNSTRLERLRHGLL